MDYFSTGMLDFGSISRRNMITLFSFYTKLNPDKQSFSVEAAKFSNESFSINFDSSFS